jgi:hypothetical protein
MLRLLVEIARSLTPAPAVAPMDGVAHQLLERAEAGAGRDPYAAQELRRAASAYLSVVR